MHSLDLDEQICLAVRVYVTTTVEFLNHQAAILTDAVLGESVKSHIDWNGRCELSIAIEFLGVWESVLVRLISTQASVYNSLTY